MTANRMVVQRRKYDDSSGLEREKIIGINRGMVFWCSVTPTETRGVETTHKTPSPWLVISSEALHNQLAIVQAVPLTTKVAQAAKQPTYRIEIPLGDVNHLPTGEKPLNADAVALTEQLRALSHERLMGQPIARLSMRTLLRVEAGISYVLGLHPGAGGVQQGSHRSP